MPSLLSTKVAAATDILHTTINAIIDDIRNRHDHKDGRGYPIDHADLLESAAMDSVDHTHANIQTHMMGAGSSFVDSPGGDEGVHGLISGQHVVGSLQGDVFVMRAGISTDVTGTTGTISFGVTFNTVICIQLTPASASGYSEYDVRITSYTTSSVSWARSSALTAIHWLVIGTKTS